MRRGSARVTPVRAAIASLPRDDPVEDGRPRAAARSPTEPSLELFLLCLTTRYEQDLVYMTRRVRRAPATASPFFGGRERGLLRLLRRGDSWVRREASGNVVLAMVRDEPVADLPSLSSARALGPTRSSWHRPR